MADRISATLIFTEHPRYAQDFRPFLRLDTDRFDSISMFGRASFWPHTLERTKFERENWSWRPTPIVVLGDVRDLPKGDVELPANATLNSKDLHIAQAIQLCRKVLQQRSPEASDNDRAIALCWVCHLVAEAHHPCNAGCLYSEELYPDGDDGATLIAVEGFRSLRDAWDSQMSPKFEPNEIDAVVKDLKADKLVNEALEKMDNKTFRSLKRDLDAEKWLTESAEIAKVHVYTKEVLQYVEAAERNGAKPMERLTLSHEYLESARKILRVRASQAARRLNDVLAEDL
jgi:hypothetical protein